MADGRQPDEQVPSILLNAQPPEGFGISADELHHYNEVCAAHLLLLRRYKQRTKTHLHHLPAQRQQLAAKQGRPHRAGRPAACGAPARREHQGRHHPSTACRSLWRQQVPGDPAQELFVPVVQGRCRRSHRAAPHCSCHHLHHHRRGRAGRARGAGMDRGHCHLGRSARRHLGAHAMVSHYLHHMCYR